MLVRGAGETFNLIVPVRRMRAYARKEGILWAIDSEFPIPTLKDISSISVEGTKSSAKEGTKATKDSVKFPVLPLVREKNEDD